MNQFLLGAMTVACGAIGLFFLRFWRRTHDRLFAHFAAGFWLLGFNWGMLTFFQKDEDHTWLYFVRLLAFILILMGVLGKNGYRSKT